MAHSRKLMNSTSRSKQSRLLVICFILLTSLTLSGTIAKSADLRDVVYTPEGGRPFNGTITATSDDQNSVVSSYVADGMLSMRLSDGVYGALFTPEVGSSWREQWSVKTPASGHVSLADIRVLPRSTISPRDGSSRDISLPIPESDVVGLVASLSSVNQAIAGDQSTLSGILQRLTSLQSLLAGVTEDLSAQVNGTSTTFSLTGSPVAGTVRLILNGLRQNLNSDFTVAGQTVTMAHAPPNGSHLSAIYTSSGSAGATKDVTLPIPMTAVTSLPQSLSSIRTSLAALTATISSLNGQVPIASSMILGELPSGAINGLNTTFVSANQPLSGLVIVYKNGLRQQLGIDYGLNGNAVQFITAPQVGDTLLEDYIAQ